MFYQSQLQLLCETFKKCHINILFAKPSDPLATFVDKSFLLLFGDNLDETLSFASFLGDVEHNVIYKISTPFKLNYLFFLLPDSAQETILMVGPFITSYINDEELFEIGEQYNISPQKQKLLKDYYSDTPLILDSSPLFAMLESFGEYVWGGNNFSVIDINKEFPIDTIPLNNDNVDNELNDILVNMNIMERRYAFENELIQAVSMGQDHRVDKIMSTFKNMPFEKRLTDQLRELKNYSIIMNTLLRKAAETGNVHPLYLDSVSSAFATKIEQQTSVEDMHNLMSEMFSSYCKLVRKHSMKNYSDVVQKAIMCINSDLAANLSLSSLAAVQNVSAGYLSTVFKKETGKTITDYINGRRVKLAKQLLSTTKLQIQTIALHCGVMDVHYFSKIFKKYTGKTPKEYRESTK